MERGYLLKQLDRQILRLNGVLEIPQELVNSRPRKKLLLRARKSSRPEDLIPLVMAQTIPDSATVHLMMLDQGMDLVTKEQLFSGHTLSELCAQLRHTAVQKKRTRELKQKTYYFSQEISFEYAMLPNRNGHPWGAYAVYKEDRSLRETPGPKSRILCREDGGLTGETREEVLGKLERVVLGKRFYDMVAEQTDRQLQRSGAVPTLKTLWFLCRSILKSTQLYDDAFFIGLFCDPSETGEALSGLVLSEAELGEEAFAILTAALGDPAENPMRWNRFNLFLNTAKDLGYLPCNPLRSSEGMKACRQRTRLAEAKFAMRKGYLTQQEQRRMYAFLTEEVTMPSSRVPIPRCVRESRYLAGAIRWLSPLSLREILALRWTNLRQIPSAIPGRTPGYQLEVMYFLNDQLRPELYRKVEMRYKYRKVAIPNFLSDLLLARKAYLMESFGFTEEMLASKPIVTGLEPGSRKTGKQGRYSRQMSWMKPEEGRKAARALLEAAGIDADILVLAQGDDRVEFDANAVSTDLFYSSYRHMLTMDRTEDFSDAEICAQLGIKPTDVYSSNYRNPENDLIQADLVEKLNASLNRILVDRADADLDRCGPVPQEALKLSTGMVSGQRKLLSGSGICTGAPGTIRLKLCSDRGIRLMVRVTKK